MSKVAYHAESKLAYGSGRADAERELTLELTVNVEPGMAINQQRVVLKSLTLDGQAYLTSLRRTYRESWNHGLWYSIDIPLDRVYRRPVLDRVAFSYQLEVPSKIVHATVTKPLVNQTIQLPDGMKLIWEPLPKRMAQVSVIGTQQTFTRLTAVARRAPDFPTDRLSDARSLGHNCWRLWLGYFAEEPEASFDLSLVVNDTTYTDEIVFKNVPLPALGK